MSLGLIGQKVGMTRIFDETGVSTPVTVIEVGPNHVTQVKTDDTDGYNALQVTVGSRRPNRVTNSFTNTGISAWRLMSTIRRYVYA